MRPILFYGGIMLNKIRNESQYKSIMELIGHNPSKAIEAGDFTRFENRGLRFNEVKLFGRGL